MSTERLNRPYKDAEASSCYSFEIGGRILGVGVREEVVDRPGSSSITVMEEPGRFRLSASVTNLTKEG